MKNKLIKDWLLLVFLLCMTVCRYILPDDKSSWISAVNFSGILLATLDLYIVVYCRYNDKYDRFNKVIGVAAIIGAILVVMQVLVMFNIIKFERRTDDIISLLTLALSLPNNLYCELIGNYVKK